jgi:hypothetical protein
MPFDPARPSIHGRLGTLVAVASALALAAPASLAGADMVYHSEHLQLTPVGSAPLRSGFVENIKAEGPQVYAHEIFVLNGALAQQDYAVSRTLFPFDPACSDEGGAFTSPVTDLRTNAAGNARGDAKLTPADVAGFEGVHGVRWTIVWKATGAPVYRTACTAVTLD